MLDNNFTFVGKVVSKNNKKYLPKVMKGKKTTIPYFEIELEVTGAQEKVFTVLIKTLGKVADYAYTTCQFGNFVKIQGIIDIKGKKEPKVTFIGTTVYRIDVSGDLDSNERDYVDIVDSLGVDYVEP